MKRLMVLFLLLSVLTIAEAGSGTAPAPVTVYGRPEEENLSAGYRYQLLSSHQVDGRQGIAWENGLFWVSGSATLSCYDASWNLIRTNALPFEGIQAQLSF